jgi:hypothetical protein
MPTAEMSSSTHLSIVFSSIVLSGFLLPIAKLGKTPVRTTGLAFGLIGCHSSVLLEEFLFLLLGFCREKGSRDSSLGQSIIIVTIL